MSPMKSPAIEENKSGVSFKLNGHAVNRFGGYSDGLTNGHTSNHNASQDDGNCTTSTTNGCGDLNGGKNHIANTSEQSSAGHGSPLRSQLGLNLKKNNMPMTNVRKTPNYLSCPLCPYASIDAVVLEEHINRSHFDPLSPSVNSSYSGSHMDTLSAFACPICTRTFESSSDLELHVNIEHRDILSPAKIDGGGCSTTASALPLSIGTTQSICPVCGICLDNFKTQDTEMHIEKHFAKSPQKPKCEPDLEKEAQKLREQREFEMLRAQYGMDDQGNFREQSAAAMQSAVYAGEMSVADYYERQVGLRAAESHGIDDNTSCTKSVVPRVLSLSASSPGVMRTLLCSSVDHYASSYGDKGWGCGYRNLQMMLSSLLQVSSSTIVDVLLLGKLISFLFQNTKYHEALYAAWGTQHPSRTAMPSISRLQKLVEAAWAQGFDLQVNSF